jgi:glutamate 5-kinase
MSANQQLHSAKRIVIKLGTQVVVELAGKTLDHFASERLARLTRQCADLVRTGKEVILVSSGAVGLGRQALQLPVGLSLTDKQACAAVGQSLLMNAYRELFAQSGLLTAQVLLTATDFADRKHYLNLRQTLETLLKLKVVPIINENDTTSTMELQEELYTKSFGDNDMLSALVASKLDADLLVILTNVDGIYTDNPATNPQATRVSKIEHFQDLQRIDATGQSLLGRGGMSSKLEAARIASISGVYTYIASGLQDEPLLPLLNATEEMPGTLVFPQASLRGKKRWIGMASGYHGIVVVNEGARKALVEKQASLLAIGVVAVQGQFSAQQVVSIQNEQGLEIGRGLTHYSGEEIDKIKGLRSERIAELLRPDHPGRQEIIHRDNLVIFAGYF